MRLIKVLFTLLLLAPSCLLLAQLEVPKNDFQRPDSLNRVNPIAPLTMLKGGYSFISDPDGRYMHRHLGRYLDDTLNIRPGDFAFWEMDSVDPVATPADSATRSGYTEFTGTSNGQATKIKLLKEGTMVFDKRQFSGDNDDTYMRFTGYDTLNPVTFNINMHSEENVVGDRNIETFNMGWNFSPAGIEVPGEGGIGMGIEYHWKPDARLLDEFHLIHVDTSGHSNRFFTFMFDNEDEMGSIGGIAVPEFELRAIDTLLSYLEFRYVPATQATQMVFTYPYNHGKGLIISSDADDNSASIGQNGFSGGGTLHIGSFNATEFSTKVKTHVNGGAGVRLKGEDGDNFFTDIEVGSTISLEDGVLDINTGGPDSVFVTGDSICVVDNMGDTLCVAQDSFYYTPDSICFIEAGDTTCFSIEMTAGPVRISDLFNADQNNIIDNAAYRQEWRWNSLAGGDGLSLTSNTTVGEGSHRLLTVELTGANNTAGVTSFASRFINQHTGTGSINYGFLSEASGGATNIGGAAYSPSGIGLRGISDTGTSLHGVSSGGLPLRAEIGHASANDVKVGLDIYRTTQGASAAAGIGSAMTFTTLTSGGFVEANRISSVYTNVTYPSHTSKLVFNGVGVGTTQDLVTMDGNGPVRFHLYGDGAITGTPTKYAAWDVNGNFIEVDPGSGVKINNLLAADGTNTIDNAGYQQEWQWNSLGNASGLKLTSTSTAAASNGQRLFDVRLSGANATASQSTYAGYFSNSHTGTGAINYGIFSEATGPGATNYGVYGNGDRGIFGQGISGGVGVHGEVTNGTGVYGLSTAIGIGVHAAATATGGIPLNVTDENGSTNTVQVAANFTRDASGTAANGIGTSITFTTETTTSSQVANTISSRWTDATNANPTSEFRISGQGNGSNVDIVGFNGLTGTTNNRRSQDKQGNDVASVAGAITLGLDGNTFEITGTNSITLISNISWQNGASVTLIFTSTATLVDGTANSGTDIGMELAGNADFSATADDVLVLKLCEIGGTQRWREVSRSAN